MSPGKRCDEILQLIDAVLEGDSAESAASDRPEPPVAVFDGGAEPPGETSSGPSDDRGMWEVA